MAPQRAAAPRPRPPRSCQDCSRRKVACDKAKPRCSRCVRAGQQCVYSSSGTSSSNSLTIIAREDETPTVAAKQQRDLSSRLDRLNRMITECDPSATSDAPVDYNVSIHQADVDNSSSSPGGRSRRYDTESESRDQFEDPGHLYLGPQTKARYVSTAFFAMISKEVSEINDLLQNQQRYAVNHVDDEGNPDETSSARTLNGQSRTGAEEKHLYGDLFPHVPACDSQYLLDGHRGKDSNVAGMLSDLPSQPQCDVLVQAYLCGYHTVTPLFHSPSFRQDMRLFFHGSQAPDSEHEINLHFIAMFLAVLFVGSVVCPRYRVKEAFGDVNREDLSNHLYKRAVLAIRLSDFPRAPSLQSLTAFIIVDSIWLRAEQPLTCCSFVGVAVRVAQMLGLHKEPSKFPEVLATDIHVRRQLWWNIVSLDAQVAFASGLPPIIESRSYDVATISELSESAINSVQSDTGGLSHITKPILRLFVGGKFEFYRIAGDFLHKLHSDSMNESDLDELLEITEKIQTELQSRRDQINSILLAFKSEPTLGDVGGGSSSATANACTLGHFTQIVLSMLAAKPFAVMHGPVRRHGVLDRLREKVPNHMMYCREYLHRFLRLTQCRDFQPWHWSWPGQHQPLYSIMALIQDLEDFPSNPLAIETRRLIDLAFHMSRAQHNEGIVSKEDGNPDARPLLEGGSAAWTFLRRARERVWAKAGLDPSVLDCPEYADDIHFEGLPGQFSDDIALPSGFLTDDMGSPDWLSLGDVPDGPFADFDMDFDMDFEL